MYKYYKEMKLSADIQCLAWKNEYYGKDFLKMSAQICNLEWFMFDNRIRKDAICIRNDFFEVYFLKEFEISNEIENWEHIFNLMEALKKELVDTMLSKGFSEKAIFDLFENNEKLANEELNDVKERRKRARRVYYWKNKEKYRESQKKSIEKNKEKYKEIQKKYAKKNREKIKERQKKYIEKNKEKYQKYQQEYRWKNREKLIEYFKIYHKRNKEKSDKLIKGADAIEFLLDLKDERLTPINQYIKAYL